MCRLALAQSQRGLGRKGGGGGGGGGLCPCLGCGPSEMQVGTDHPLSELKLELRKYVTQAGEECGGETTQMCMQAPVKEEKDLGFY